MSLLKPTKTKKTLPPPQKKYRKTPHNTIPKPNKLKTKKEIKPICFITLKKMQSTKVLNGVFS